MLGPRYTIHSFHSSSVPLGKAREHLPAGQPSHWCLLSIPFSHPPAMWEPVISVWNSIKQSGCTGSVQTASTGMTYPQLLYEFRGISSSLWNPFHCLNWSQHMSVSMNPTELRAIASLVGVCFFFLMWKLVISCKDFTTKNWKLCIRKQPAQPGCTCKV